MGWSKGAGNGVVRLRDRDQWTVALQAPGHDAGDEPRSVPWPGDKTEKYRAAPNGRHDDQTGRRPVRASKFAANIWKPSLQMLVTSNQSGLWGYDDPAAD
jgi:hypothetical protein